MKITALETVRVAAFPALLFLEVSTDEGLIGLGETCLGAEAVEAHLHEAVAPLLLGQDPLRIGAHNRALYDDFVGYADTGVATRARSALDIALWDLLGQVSGQPLYQLLGGAHRDGIPVYNTCAGPGYGATSSNVDRIGNWDDTRPRGGYEDLDAVRTRPGELAAELLDEGVTAMKFWPLDGAALAGEGVRVTAEALRAAVRPLAEIRAAVGDRMDILVDLHGLWRMPAVREVLRALDEYRPYWIEDPVKADHLDLLPGLARDCRAPLAMGETVANVGNFDRLLGTGAVGVAMFDVGWVGGITEAVRVASLADQRGIPIAPHDCTGPVVLTVGTHLCLSSPNALMQETVRAFLRGWYGELVTELPVLERGLIRPPYGPGLGTALHPDVRRRADVRTRRSAS
jgi:L-alanine-DL-glutamate epimerase-like enolase superfamily enzyme